MPDVSYCNTSYATPVPDPAPVAVNDTPTVFEAAPIAVKSVVPTVLISYFLPTTNAPAEVSKSEAPETVVPEPVNRYVYFTNVVFASVVAVFALPPQPDGAASCQFDPS
jgi:hypothetical protein